MAIGYDTGAGGGMGNRPPDLDGLADLWERIRDEAEDRLEAVWDWVPRIERVAQWVLRHVQVVYPVEWYTWQTAADERTCPECGAYAGDLWPEGRPHPAPPLHTNCRCQIVHHHTEWRIRYEERWSLEWFSQTAWDWKVTRWE